MYPSIGARGEFNVWELVGGWAVEGVEDAKKTVRRGGNKRRRGESCFLGMFYRHRSCFHEMLPDSSSVQLL
jgi:hypothetical protein